MACLCVLLMLALRFPLLGLAGLVLIVEAVVLKKEGGRALC